MERANARLKDLRILSFIPSYLRCYADVLFQLVAALVNLQFPLIKEGCEDVVFELFFFLVYYRVRLHVCYRLK